MKSQTEIAVTNYRSKEYIFIINRKSIGFNFEDLFNITVRDLILDEFSSEAISIDNGQFA